MSPEDRAAFIRELSETLGAPAHSSLSDDEQRWVRMAIKREAQSIELRKAIIEKTLVGLAWMAVLWLGSMFLTWASAHGYKP